MKDNLIEWVIKMSWKIISLIFALVILCVPAIAQVGSQVSIQDGNVYVSTTSEITVPQGNVYSIALGGGSAPNYNWVVTPSSGLKLLSNTSGSITFLAVDKGQQTITAEYRNPLETKPIQTVTIVVNVV
jgi:predicted secreted protein